MNPVPPMPSDGARRDCPLNQYAARTAEAAVRAAEMIELSRIANGYPVSKSFSTSTADARGKPRWTFPGKLAIHFSPATPTPSPRYAGSAMIRQSGLSGKRRKWLSGLIECPLACARYAFRTTSMHAARLAPMMSLTVLPLMIESSKSMVVALFEFRGPRGIEHSIQVRRPAVRAQEQHPWALASSPRGHPRRIPLDRREGSPAGTAREQPVRREELVARHDGLALGNQDDVVDQGLRQERRNDARANAGNVTFAGCIAEDDGAFGIDGNNPDVRVALFEPTRHAGDRSPRADTDEDIVERPEIGADLSSRELVVRLHGVRVAVLVRPVRVRGRRTQALHHLEASLQESAGVVALLNLHNGGTGAPEERLIGTGDVGIDHRDEPQTDQAAEGGEGRGKVSRRRLDHRCLLADLTALRRPLEDPKGGAVLDAADRVHVLELGEQVHALDSQRHMRCGPQRSAEHCQAGQESRRRPRLPSALWERARESLDRDGQSHLELASRGQFHQHIRRPSQIGGGAHRRVHDGAELDVGSDVEGRFHMRGQPALRADPIERRRGDAGEGLVERRGGPSGTDQASDRDPL